jgi:tetratricopeptide (TPR) repeat protein
MGADRHHNRYRRPHGRLAPWPTDRAAPDRSTQRHSTCQDELWWNSDDRRGVGRETSLAKGVARFEGMPPGEPFVGRTQELSSLVSWLDEVVATGVGRFVLVSGESGAGKTRLCAEFDRRLATQGVVSLWSRCWEAGGGPPLWPWPDVIRELNERVPRHRTDAYGTTVGDRFAMFQSVLNELRAGCSTGPVVVLLDDLHVANPDVVLLTRFIARSLHRLPLLLVATWRRGGADGGESADHLDSVVREATVIELGPFEHADVAEYVRLCGAENRWARNLADLLTVSGGNPMLLGELVRQGWRAADGAGGRGLCLALARRVAGLDERERAILGVAAAFGDGAGVGEIAGIVGCPTVDVHAAVNRVTTVAEVVNGRVRFSHDLWREAFDAALPTADRLAVHEAAMDSMRPIEADQLAWRAHHAVEAAGLSPAHIPSAVAACAEAAELLQRELALEQAAEWAATGCQLAVGASSPEAEAQLLLIHAGAVLASGRLSEAREVFSRAVEAADRCRNPRYLAAAALGLGGVWVEEQRDELSRRRLLTLCRRAMAELPDDELALAARLAVRLAAERAYDRGSVTEVFNQVDAVRQLGDPAVTAEALSLLHHTLLGPEHATARLEIADELLDVAVAAGGTIYPLFGLCWKTIDLYLAGALDADRSFIELRDRSDTLGCRSIGYIAAVLDVMRTIRCGDLERAEDLAESAFTLGGAVGDADALAYYGGHLLAIRWLQGRLGEMRDLVGSVIESSTLRRRDVSYTAVLALICALDGDERAARAAVDAVVASGLDSVGVPSNRMITWTILVETAGVLGDTALAAQLAKTVEPFAHLPVMPSLAIACLGPGERVMGVACATAGRRQEAVDWFRAALDANRRIGNRPIDALIHGQLADLLRVGSSADRDEAAGHYAAAIKAGAGCGMNRRVTAWIESAASIQTPVGLKTRMGLFEECTNGWHIDIDGRSTTVDHLAGLRYIAILLSRPDTDIPAAELAAAVDGCPVVEPDSAVPMIDEQARGSYEQRIRELDHDLDTADAIGDVELGRRAAQERQFLIDHLRKATALRGRLRNLSGDTNERCRMRVSKAIHRSIRRVSEADQVLGHTLATRIQAGYECRYVSDPGDPIVWTVRTRPVATSA